ncbi:MAG: M24 family metallopeptidase [Planctomycetota bacterium]
MPILLAGIAKTNMALFHRCQFGVGDPSAWLELPGETVFVCRDIEVGRAKKTVRADRVLCPADVVPNDELSGERDVATAQAVAKLLAAAGHASVTGDRSLGLVYLDVLRAAGIDVRLDRDLGIADRRSKSAEEVEHIKACQAATEDALAFASQTIHNATAGAGGILQHDGSPLTSERLREMIELALMQRGKFSDSGMIVAGKPHCSDCHDRGSGPLRTGEPIIVDVFPHDRATMYWGDATRTFVHGQPTDALKKMHAAVVEAKAAAIAVVRPGATGADVHAATVATLEKHGYHFGMPEGDEPTMPHGTGHGVGLEVHEAPLLDAKGGPLVQGDILTIEPGLYGTADGGVRVEDMVLVTEDGCENFNRLSEDL